MKSLLSYFLFDAARATEANLIKATELNGNVISLYRGRSEEILSAVGPHVFSHRHSEEFDTFIREKGWGNAWGVFLSTESSLEETYNHFCRFLLVKTEDQDQLYFRFYDPRVLRIFLPTCDCEQLQEFFGPVHQFIVEDEDPEYALVFGLDSRGLLQISRIPATNYLEAIDDNNPLTSGSSSPSRGKRWYYLDE